MRENIVPEPKKALLKSAEAGLEKKKTLNLNVYLEKLTSFLTATKNVFLKLYRFFRNNKNNSKVMLFLAILTT